MDDALEGGDVPMNNPVLLTAGVLILALGFVSGPALSSGQDKTTKVSAIVRDAVVAGGPKDFMEVRHLVLKGSNEAIGKALATIAIDRYGVKPAPSTDRFRTGVQRRYIEKNYPI